MFTGCSDANERKVNENGDIIKISVNTEESHESTQSGIHMT